MADSSQSADSFPYPSGTVVGVVADDAALDDTRRRLTAANFGPDRYEVLHGEAGLARIDVEGAGHGRSGRLKRLLQDALSDDENHVRRYAEHLREGRYVVGVKVGDDEAAKRAPPRRSVRRTRSSCTTTRIPTSRTSEPSGSAFARACSGMEAAGGPVSSQ